MLSTLCTMGCFVGMLISSTELAVATVKTVVQGLMAVAAYSRVAGPGPRSQVPHNGLGNMTAI